MILTHQVQTQKNATKRKMAHHLASPQLATILLTAVTRIVAESNLIRIFTDQGQLAGGGTASDCPIDDEQNVPDLPVKNQATMPLRCHCQKSPCLPPETKLNGRRWDSITPTLEKWRPNRRGN